MTISTPPPPNITSLGERLGRNIATQRHLRGWTQQELAEKVGIDSVTVSRIETGTSLPSLVRLATIADTLGVTLAELVSGVSPHASDHVQAIAECFLPLSEADRYLLIDTMKRFAARLQQR